MDLRRWNVKHLRMLLDAAPDFAPFPRRGDVGWPAFMDRIAPHLGPLLAAAEQDVQSQVPALPARLYHEFRDTGAREGYEDAQRLRRNQLYRLTLAAWLEKAERFVPALEELVWARLEETNWAWPAHARTLDTPDHPTLDLAAAMTALDLAELDYLVGDCLSPNLRMRLRFEVERRVIGPFLDRNDHWWLHTTPAKQVNNWTAVCVAGAVGAAIYLERDIDRLAAIITRGLHSLADYLDTFDSDGGSTEGPDYWTYGFGNYVVLAQLLHARSGGAVDLLDGVDLRAIAQFPLRTMLAPGVWVSFSDSDHNPVFHPGLLSYLADRMDIPDLCGIGMVNDYTVADFNQFAWPLRQYAMPLPDNAAPAQLGLHDWYADMGWMVSRLNPADPAALSLAAKGGHNDEMHNQNDLGSFMVVSSGVVALTDPGRGRYSKAYFGPDRYQNLMASSRGHSVPVVNGFEQVPGRDHAARVLHRSHTADVDRLELDLTSAYPQQAGLASLHRSLTLDRTTKGGRVVLEDSYAFENGSGTFQSVLVTPLVAKPSTTEVLIGTKGAGVRVAYVAGAVAVSCEHHPGVEKQYQPAVDLTRVLFTPVQPAKKGQVTLTMVPL